jgi:hypothetical protein
LVTDRVGSIAIDVWKDTYANFPPNNADSITGSNEPALVNARKNQDTDISGWTTSISSGDILAFNVDSARTVQRAVLSLNITK